MEGRGRVKSFRSHLYLLFLVSITIPVILLAVLLSGYYNMRLTQENQISRSNTLSAVSYNIQTIFTELEVMAFTPYLHKDILTAMTYMKNGLLLDPPSYLDVSSYEGKYEMTFSKLMFTGKQNVHSISFFPDSDGGEYCYTIARTPAALRVLDGEGYQATQWYENALESQNAVLSPIYDESRPFGAERFYYYRSIRDFDSGRDIGVLRVEADTAKIKQILDNIELDGISVLLLADSSGGVICQNTAGSEISSVSELDALDKDFFVTTASLWGTDWSLYYLADKSPLKAAQTNTFIAAFALCLVVFLVSSVIYRRRSRETVASVDNILSTLEEIQGGNFDVRSSVNTVGDLADISQGINRMAQKTKQHIQQEYKAVIEQQKAQYLALQSQINPHFLYNTLNDFIALNRMGQKDLLEQSILQLTQLFRYSSSNADKAAIGEELRFCRDYLGLRQLQLEDRLEYHIEIEPGCEEIEIPRLIIQPLVENSVIHGLGDDVEGIFINIHAGLIETKDGKAVEISVEDNGQGFNTSDGDDSRRHVGLSNVRERVELFKPDSRLDIVSEPGHGVRCIITIGQESGGVTKNENINS